MQLKEFDIILDIKKSYKTERFEVVQGDSYSNVLNIRLVDGLHSYDLTGTTVEIVFSKSDGTTVQQTDITIINESRGRIQCILKTNTIASPGKVIAEVRVLEGETLLTSTRFEFYVRKSLITDETIESTNEFPLLTELINTTNGLIDQVEQIEKQVPENVVTELNQVSTLANQLQQDLIAHKAETASKHITESGSNENGRYIKFDDGTLIQYSTNKSLTFASSDVLFANWIFPAGFVNNEYSVVFTNSSGVTSESQNKNLFHNEFTNTSNTYCALIVRGSANTFTSGDTTTVKATAIGRWK